MIKAWIHKYLKKEGAEVFNDIEGWRSYYFGLIMCLACILLPIALAVNISTYIAENRWGTLIFQIGIFIFLAILFFTRNTLARWGMFFIFLYATVITFFVSLGPFYARSGWLVFCTVTAALLFGIPAALASVGFNAIILLVLYFFVGPHLQSWASAYTEPDIKWIIFVVNLSFVSLVASLPVSLLLRRLSVSFLHEQDMRLKLHKESESQREMNVILSNEITERKRIENELRESEKSYRLLAENVRDVIWIFDLNLGYTFVTPSVQRLRGYTMEEALNQTMDQILTPESYRMAKETLEREFKLELSGKRHGPEWSITSELEMNRKDGSTVWTEVTMNIVYNDIDEATGIMGVTRDISDRKKAEDALRNSEEKYRLLVENANEAIFVAQDAMIKFCNTKTLELLGSSQEEVLFRAFVNHIHPEDRDMVIERHQSRIQEDAAPSVYPFRLTDKNGIIKWVEVNAILITWDGKPATLNFLTDITERKKAEEALRKSEERYRTVFERTATANIIEAEDTTILMANAHFEEITGYSKDEIEGKMSWTRFVAEEDLERVKTNQKTRRLKPESVPNTYELRLVNRHGQVRNLFMSVAVIPETKESVASMIDITERKRAEEEKKKLEAQLSQAQKLESIGTLAGGIAHDFNNILSAIIGYTQLAMDDASDQNKVRKELNEVLKAGDRAKDLVSHILTFSRQTETRHSPLALHTIIKETIKMMRSVIPTTVEIRQNLIDSGIVMSDPTEIHQIMMNLCINAVHAMDKTGGVLEVRLKRQHLNGDSDIQGLDLSPGSYLRLSVSDNGQGMTPEIMARIFDPYFTTKEVGRGTGLGLSVVHGIVKSHGGVVTCKSTPGEGTTFDLYFPEIETGKEMSASRGKESLPSGTEQILFVDDEPVLVDLAKRMMEGLGYSVDTRTSSIEALELFRNNPDRFDLVITDMTMPGMTGDRLTQRLMEIRQDIPIILCTGYSEHITEERSKMIGIREFVMKPFLKNELAKTIRKVLDQG